MKQRTSDIREIIDAETRAKLVWAVFFTGVSFLLGAAVLGIFKGDFAALQSVWTVVGPAFGGIAAYFFSRKR